MVGEDDNTPSLLPAEWNIPGVLRDRLGNRPGKQRALTHDGHLLLVLHAPPTPQEQQRRGRYFWRSPTGTWEVAPPGECPEGLSAHLHDYNLTLDALDRLEEEADTCEEYFELISRLTPLARATRNLHNTLQKAREAVPDDRRLVLARDQAYAMARRAELLYEDSKNALEFVIAQQAEAQAESSHQMATSSYRLNVLVALFFPVATLMAIFGANLHHGLESLDKTPAPWVLGAVTAAGLLLGAVLVWFVTRPAPRPRNFYARKRPRRSSATESAPVTGE